MEHLLPTYSSFTTGGMSSLLKRLIFAVLPVASVSVLFSGCASSRLGSTQTAAMKTNSIPSPVVQSNTAPKADYVVHPIPPQRPPDDTVPATILAWDAKNKTYNAKASDELAHFTFSLTNVSTGPVVIYATSTSCGCTVAQLPQNPWVLEPGSNGQINVTMDLHGKVDDVTKEVTVFTSKGNTVLTVETIIERSSQSSAVPFSRPIYSYRSDSIGSRFAALKAG